MATFTLEESTRKIIEFLEDEISVKEDFQTEVEMPRWKRWAYLFFVNRASWSVQGWGVRTHRHGHPCGLLENQGLELLQIDALMLGWIMMVGPEAVYSLLEDYLDKYLEDFPELLAAYPKQRKDESTGDRQ